MCVLWSSRGQDLLNVCEKLLCTSTYGAQTLIELCIQIKLIVAHVVRCPQNKLSRCWESWPHDIPSYQRIFYHGGWIYQGIFGWRVKNMLWNIILCSRSHSHIHKIAFMGTIRYPSKCWYSSKVMEDTWVEFLGLTINSFQI